MKKIIITIFAVALASMAFAQVDEKEQQRQQEELLKQQQKEQQDLLKQQQKEQEKAMKAEAKEQAKEQAAMQAKQEKKQKKAERKAEIGRGVRLSVDPFYAMTLNTGWQDRAELYHSGSMLGRGYRGDIVWGADLVLHFPLSKSWNFNLGAGYRWTRFAYTNNVLFNPATTALELATTFQPLETRSNLLLQTITVPVYFAHVDSDNKKELFFGVELGYNYKADFNYKQLQSNSEWNTTTTPDAIGLFNQYRCDVTIGTGEKLFIFNPGTRLYFNILPTYTADGGRIHEFGLVYSL